MPAYEIGHRDVAALVIQLDNGGYFGVTGDPRFRFRRGRGLWLGRRGRLRRLITVHPPQVFQIEDELPCRWIVMPFEVAFLEAPT